MYKEKYREDTDFKKSNREVTMTPRPHKYWCMSCDCQLVGDYKKCPNCGFRNNRRRSKK